MEALDAAIAFIESSVCDPDITDEMIEKYEVYRKAIDKLHERSSK